VRFEKTESVVKLDVEGVFIEIGSVPSSDYIKGIGKNASGEIYVNAKCETNLPGVLLMGLIAVLGALADRLLSLYPAATDAEAHAAAAQAVFGRRHGHLRHALAFHGEAALRNAARTLDPFRRATQPLPQLPVAHLALGKIAAKCLQESHRDTYRLLSR